MDGPRDFENIRSGGMVPYRHVGHSPSVGADDPIDIRAVPIETPRVHTIYPTILPMNSNSNQERDMADYARRLYEAQQARRQQNSQSQQVDGIGGIFRATPTLVRWGFVGLAGIALTVGASRLIASPRPSAPTPKQDLPSDQLAAAASASAQAVDPNPAIIAALERMESENQLLRQQAAAAQQELLNQARNTQPWIGINMCIWNCTGKPSNPEPVRPDPLQLQQSASLVNSRQDSDSELSQTPEYSGPRDLNILIAPQAPQVPQAVPAQPTEPFGVEFARSYLEDHRVPLVRPRHELGIPDGQFHLPGRAYDNDTFMRSVDHFRSILYNQPEVYLAQVIGAARSNPTSFSIENYDALVYVESVRVQQ